MFLKKKLIKNVQNDMTFKNQLLKNTKYNKKSIFSILGKFAIFDIFFPLRRKYVLKLKQLFFVKILIAEFMLNIFKMYMDLYDILPQYTTDSISFTFYNKLSLL